MAQIKGRVTTSSGAPLSGAAVITDLLFQATSGETGDYVLSARSRPDWKPKLVIFYAPGFRPLVKSISEDPVVDAALDPAGGSERRVHACSATPQGEQRVGGLMSFALPREVKSVKSHDVDYTLQQLVYRSGKKSYALAIWEGPSCCYGRPIADKDVLSAASSMRTWIFQEPGKNLSGLDMKGKSADGTFWRWMGPRMGSQIEYKGATETVAGVFDKIIDSMCVAVR
jgi:hypothetical protein